VSDIAPARNIDACQYFEEGTLAATIGADNTKELALFDAEVYVVQYGVLTCWDAPKQSSSVPLKRADLLVRNAKLLPEMANRDGGVCITHD
jgi:hypothetical protein